MFPHLSRTTNAVDFILVMSDVCTQNLNKARFWKIPLLAGLNIKTLSFKFGSNHFLGLYELKKSKEIGSIFIEDRQPDGWNCLKFLNFFLSKNLKSYETIVFIFFTYAYISKLFYNNEDKKYIF